MSVFHRPDKLMSSIIQLTSQRDRHGLETSLVHIIHDLIENGNITLYRILPSGKEAVPVIRCLSEGIVIEYTGFGQALLNILPLSKNPLWQQSCDTLMVSHNFAHSRFSTIYPIIGGRHVVGLLEIIAPAELNDTQKSIINGLLQVYRNYITLLDDSERDMLTGLMNRKTFGKYYDRMIEAGQALLPSETICDKLAADEDRRSLIHTGTAHEWIAMIDIDFFKKINDKFGHLYGDEVLLLLARIMESTFRSSDGLFRFGGEEFVVMLGKTTQYDAINVFERFRQAVADYIFPTVGRVTVSLGVAVLSSTENKEIVLERADKALYQAKETGRNKVVLAS
jgi:diguanylate cyclase (GGDEF)-like protein